MELSDIEKKMVARLRRKQEQMLRWRWWLLLTGISCFAASGYALSLLLRLLHEPDLTSVLIIACSLPQIYLGVLFGTVVIGYTWTNWNGNPQTRLLLRLLDEKRDG
jgi:hypothetical protein